MRKIIVSFIAFFYCIGLSAQNTAAEKVYAFKITGYNRLINDSITLVQVVNPEDWPVKIKDKQLGVLKHCYRQGATLDTAIIGYGRCNLIKGDYHYFSIRLNKNQQPAAGDLLYLLLNIPAVYDGLLLNVMSHAIEFTDVYVKKFLAGSAIFTNNKQNELSILDSMVADIHTTGSVMQVQMPEQDKPIKGGIYNGKKLFTAMQAASRAEIEMFLKYVIARPIKYAGNTWKISETFATWMSSSTPTVIDH